MSEHKGFRNYRRVRDWLPIVFAGCSMFFAGTASTQPDLSGVWVPVAERADSWNESNLPLTEQAGESLANYDSRRHDSVRYCMPMGTPRNTLATAGYPLEILQTPAQLTMIFDGRGDVRRIFLDDRGHPADPIPGWMGHSTGDWQRDTLIVDTIGMTAESRLTAAGLPHSDAMQLRETWSLVEEGAETLLSVELRIDDPAMYEQPLHAVRYFRRAPFSMPRETAAVCQLDQWRDQLERRSKELSMQLRSQTVSNTGDAP